MVLRLCGAVAQDSSCRTMDRTGPGPAGPRGWEGGRPGSACLRPGHTKTIETCLKPSHEGPHGGATLSLGGQS